MRTVVVLRWFEGQPPRRIAAALGVPAAIVSTQLHRALALLRQRLDAAHGGDRRALTPSPPVHAVPGLAQHSAAGQGDDAVGTLTARANEQYIRGNGKEARLATICASLPVPTGFVTLAAAKVAGE